MLYKLPGFCNAWDLKRMTSGTKFDTALNLC